MSKQKVGSEQSKQGVPCTNLALRLEIKKKSRRDNASSTPAPIFNAASGANEIGTGL
ncbi:MAG: hypothetical protein HDR54_07530 [Treponema sp.]|nr:hypothetical protein [Treponema sp.]